MIARPTKHREKLLLNVLPAAAVLALYAFLFAIPAQREYQAVRETFNTRQATAVSQTLAQQSRQSLLLAESGLARLNEQVRHDRDEIAFHGRRWDSADARLSTVQHVTELLQQFNLSIVKQDFQQQPQLPLYMNQLEEIITQHAADQSVLEYWQIELAGGYSDMMKFLEQIKNDGPRTFPIALTMKASDSGDGIHTWSVVFVV